MIQNATLSRNTKKAGSFEYRHTTLDTGFFATCCLFCSIGGVFCKAGSDEILPSSRGCCCRSIATSCCNPTMASCCCLCNATIAGCNGVASAIGASGSLEDTGSRTGRIGALVTLGTSGCCGCWASNRSNLAFISGCCCKTMSTFRFSRVSMALIRRSIMAPKEGCFFLRDDLFLVDLLFFLVERFFFLRDDLFFFSVELHRLVLVLHVEG